jgi:RNA polymerase sigma-54 factor
VAPSHKRRQVLSTPQFRERCVVAGWRKDGESRVETNQTPKKEWAKSAREAQYHKMLQMGAQELRIYLENMLHENPVLEVEDSYHQKEDDETELKLEWLETADAQNRPYYESDAGESGDPMSNYGAVEEEQNLGFYLDAQLRLLDLPQELKRAAQYVIENLDDNGYLQETEQEMARCLGVSGQLMGEALEMVRSLEPAGVGARNLQDCLCLQLLRREEMADSLPVQIVKEYLAAMAERNTALIARHLNAEETKVREACRMIRSLNPRPGAEFCKRQNLLYLNPDVFVVKFPGHFELLTNDYYFPVLCISDEYRHMLKTTEDPEVKAYLSARLREAQWVIQGVERRRNTLLACTQEIVSVQSLFFQEGPGHLVPFPLRDAALRIKLSEQEMEQVVRDKYLQCSSGVYPFGYFFPRPH